MREAMAIASQRADIELTKASRRAQRPSPSRLAPVVLAEVVATSARILRGGSHGAVAVEGGYTPQASPFAWLGPGRLRSGRVPPEAAKCGDLVTASAAAALSFSMILAITASRLRSNTARFSITNCCELRRPTRWELICGTTYRATRSQLRDVFSGFAQSWTKPTRVPKPPLTSRTDLILATRSSGVPMVAAAPSANAALSTASSGEL